MIRATAVLAIASATMATPSAEASEVFSGCSVCSNTCELSACQAWCPTAIWPPMCSSGLCMGEGGGFYWLNVTCRTEPQ